MYVYCQPMGMNLFEYRGASTVPVALVCCMIKYQGGFPSGESG